MIDKDSERLLLLLKAWAHMCFKQFTVW
jgi:hypothetical protein